MKNSAGKMIRNNIVVGLMLVAPIAITGLIISFLVKLLADNRLTQFIADMLFRMMPQTMRDGTMQMILGQFVSVLLLLVLLFFVGFFVRSFIGRRLYRVAEKVLVRIPVFNKIYVQVRHISETIFSQRQTMFKEVVLLEYPRRGIFSIGFVTGSVPEPFVQRTLPPEIHEPVSAVFVPTTPNPTSGIMLLAPRSELRVLSLTVADAMKLVISGGAVYPGDDPVDNRPTLLDKLETWIAKETKLDVSSATPPEEDLHS
jgi:uncharacterized membrane protein